MTSDCVHEVAANNTANMLQETVVIQLSWLVTFAFV